MNASVVGHEDTIAEQVGDVLGEVFESRASSTMSSEIPEAVILDGIGSNGLTNDVHRSKI